MAGDMLQKFKNSVNKGVTTVNVKASSSLEKMKLKSKMDAVAAEIQKLMEQVGERAYAVWSAGEHEFGVLEELLQAIQEKKGDLERLQLEYESIALRDEQILGSATKVEEASGMKVCSKCYATCDEDTKFCMHCGQKM